MGAVVFFVKLRSALPERMDPPRPTWRRDSHAAPVQRGIIGVAELGLSVPRVETLKINCTWGGGTHIARIWKYEGPRRCGRSPTTWRPYQGRRGRNHLRGSLA